LLKEFKMSDQVIETPVADIKPQRKIDALEPVMVAEKEILISEIYVCSQGEGPLTGTPSILIRTSACNLRCRWKDPKTGSLNI
jgi:hypothetical protein